MGAKHHLQSLLLAAAVLLVYGPAYAHPGRTDAQGGHYVRTAGWGYPVGSYHCHSGERSGETRTPIHGGTDNGWIWYLLLAYPVLSVVSGFLWAKAGDSWWFGFATGLFAGPIISIPAGIYKVVKSRRAPPGST
jgi:hypothetical protein